MFKFPAEIKRTINWSHERGSWQYDLLCLLIIAAIFLIPGRFFGDRDRPGLSAGVESVGTDKARIVETEIEVSAVESFLDQRGRSDLADFPVEALGFYLREQYNQTVRLLRYEQYVDSRQTARYRVWFEEVNPRR